MYISDLFLDMAIDNLKEQWTSPRHRVVAAAMCLGHPGLDRMDDLMNWCKDINALPQEFVDHEGLTVGQVMDKLNLRIIG